MLLSATHDLFDTVEKFTSLACRITQLLLVFMVLFLLSVFSSYYLENLFQWQVISNIPKWKFIMYYCGGIWLLYNLTYHYVMAHKIGPGHPSDIPYSLLQKFVVKRCQKCHCRKPTRTHHCSICDTCILQMDHHCPWMGTCIGHYNKKYFVMFLTWLTLGSFLIIELIRDLELVRGEVYIFMIVIGSIIGVFCLFHWILVLKGFTTLELCLVNDNYQPSKSYATNFEIVFGTKNVLYALLPIYIALPGIGIEWTMGSHNRNRMQEIIELEQSQFYIAESNI